MKSALSCWLTAIAVLHAGFLWGKLGTAQAAERRLAVLEFQGSKIEEDTLKTFTDAVRGGALEGLAGRGVDVMTRENMMAMLKAMGKKECNEGECEVETARNIGADYVVSGSVTHIENLYVVTLKIHESKNGSLLATDMVKAKTQVQVLDQLREHGRDLLKASMGRTRSSGRGQKDHDQGGDAALALQPPEPPSSISPVEGSEAAEATSAPEHKLQLGLSFLPMALGRAPISSSDIKFDAHTASVPLAYGLGLSLDYRLTSKLTIGLAPQVVFRFTPNDYYMPNTTEYDLMMRIAYTFIVFPKLALYVEALPGYAILDFSWSYYGFKTASGLVMAGGLGAMTDLSDRLFVSFGIGYQAIFQSSSVSSSYGDEFWFKTRFLRIALGVGMKL
jgi:TolB-like protein